MPDRTGLEWNADEQYWDGGSAPRGIRVKNVLLWSIPIMVLVALAVMLVVLVPGIYHNPESPYVPPNASYPD
ncbi:hypothetical protein ACFVWN_11125 [Nocardiopsis flavescens]|uniref:hypothetical protein n=1 Tax=Nocardiopsis flavescens TaxID=758803 RepID=UPI00366149A6